MVLFALKLLAASDLEDIQKNSIKDSIIRPMLARDENNFN
jgi:hypothetical protein